MQVWCMDKQVRRQDRITSTVEIGRPKPEGQKVERGQSGREAPKSERVSLGEKQGEWKAEGHEFLGGEAAKDGCEARDMHGSREMFPQCVGCRKARWLLEYAAGGGGLEREGRA